MPVISSSGSAPKVVVVQRRKNVAAIADRTKVMNVSSPGVRGPKGPMGPEGDGGVSKFDTNLALLYSVAKA